MYPKTFIYFYPARECPATDLSANPEENVLSVKMQAPDTPINVWISSDLHVRIHLISESYRSCPYEDTLVHTQNIALGHSA